MSEILDLSALKTRIKNFAIERDWEQFHSPKNISMALNVEASELLEIFQWLTEEQSRNLSDKSANQDTRKQIEEEISDIIVYATRLCGLLDINIVEAIDRKMELNAKKYPVEKARGTAKKYNKL